MWWEGSGEVQRLTIQAASPLSAQGLYSALSEFSPDFTTDDEGTCFVSVDLGSDRHVVFVLDSLQRFVDSRAAGAAVNTVVVQLDDRRYRTNGAARASAAPV
jgi:hypothetical protein